MRAWKKGIRQMRVCHVKSARFDDPTLVSTAGLVPVMALAQRAGLMGLVAEHVSVPGTADANAPGKVTAVVAGMVADSDSLEDLAVPPTAPRARRRVSCHICLRGTARWPSTPVRG